MSKICPKCNSQTNDTAKYCQQCGHLLTGEPLNLAWITAIQEKIKDARRSELFAFIWTVICAILAAAIFITHIALQMQWALMGWVATIGFLILFVLGSVTNQRYKKQKEELINQLEKGM